MQRQSANITYILLYHIMRTQKAALLWQYRNAYLLVTTGGRRGPDGEGSKMVKMRLEVFPHRIRKLVRRISGQDLKQVGMGDFSHRRVLKF